MDATGDDQDGADGGASSRSLAMPRRRSAEERPAPVRPNSAEWGGRDLETRPVRETVVYETREVPLPLPRRRRRLSKAAAAWFVLAFALPVLLGAFYYTAIASDQYTTEFRFTVREPEGAATAGAGGGGISAVLGASATGAALHNHTVVDYVSSAQAARDLQPTLDLRRMFSAADIDPLSRLKQGSSDEELSRFWKRQVYASFDSATGLAMVRVRAFEPGDALRIAEQLIARSEALVNGAGQQSRADSAGFTEREVSRAESELASLRNQLTGLRLQSGVIDPQTSVVAGNAALANTLRARLTELQTRRAALRTGVTDPTAPQIIQLDSQIAASQAQLADVSGAASVSGGLSTTVARFEQLRVQTQAAEQALLTARANLQQAVTASDAERVYMVVYVRPSEPRSATHPDRVESIGLVVLVSLFVWIIGVLLGRSVLEHAT